MEKTEVNFLSPYKLMPPKLTKNLRELWYGVLAWIGKNNEEFIVLLFILFIAALFRLYKIDQYMTFLGDEGRDVIIVRRFLVEHHIMLIGPGTSIGNMYLGPLYYYLMAPVLFLFNFSPVGPAVQIAVLGVFTVYLVWLMSREWFGRVAAFVAASLYAISPVVITYSRSSWNPNIMPFFAIICIYSLWKIFKYSEWIWLLVLGISFAFVLQSHYLGLLLLPVILVYWFLTYFKIKTHIPKPKFLTKELFKNTLLAMLLFFSLMSPLVFFDARHGWNNFNALKLFLTERQTTVSANPIKNLPNIFPIFNKSVTRLVAGGDVTFGTVASVVLGVGLLWLVVTYLRREGSKTSILKSPITLLFTWLLFAMVGLSLYKQEIYDHYYGFFFPASFILLGLITQEIVHKAKYMTQKYYKIILALFGVFYVLLVTINLMKNPLLSPPNMQLQRTEEVAKFIKNDARGNKFNFAVIAERNYEGAYKYFLQLWGTGIIDIDPLNTKDTIADSLYVVCEKPKEKCDPTHNAKAEVANFGWSKIENAWNIFGTTTYRLIHTR
ncbi:glycosyltransferase family 39 protein [Candidatus Woesebacteria bacterium]|nr:glycosyltransferase family 39 protein [Candidatus Woesebacteria bacterium]